MSRLGKLPIALPSGVKAEWKDGLLTVSGSKGTLTRTVKPDVEVSVTDEAIIISPKPDSEAGRVLWGTYAAHARNMVKGVTEGFEKKLEIEGVGYRAEVKGTNLVLSVGYSHPVELPIPAGVSATVEKNVITLTGADLEVVGQFAANVRKVRKPEPYKGKGIRYQGEYIIRKQGKKAV